MKQKILQSLLILGFFIIFGYVYGDEFWDYQDTKQQEQIYKTSVGEQTSDFDIQDISDLPETEFFVTPNLGLLDDIVDQIDDAQDRVYVEVYIFTERDIRNALIRAHTRGVEVKVLLENNPYKAPYLNDPHYNDLKDAGVNVVWSDPLNYSLNHSKLLIIDSYAYISTGNFSYSLFKYNRDFLVKIGDAEMLKVLDELFLGDFTHQNIGVYHDNLVLSPDYSRDKLQGLVQSASESVDFYFPYILDDEFQKVLFEIAGKGVIVRGIVDKDFYEENLDIVKLYNENNIVIYPINSGKLHAKSIIVDDARAYIGSINFSTYSFDENREIGIILHTPRVIEKMREVFYSDL